MDTDLTTSTVRVDESSYQLSNGKTGHCKNALPIEQLLCMILRALEMEDRRDRAMTAELDVTQSVILASGDNVTAPNFGQFVGFLDRLDSAVIDFVD